MRNIDRRIHKHGAITIELLVVVQTIFNFDTRNNLLKMRCNQNNGVRQCVLSGFDNMKDSVKMVGNPSFRRSVIPY